MKKYRYQEYKVLQEKRQKRLASVLRRKKVIYCFSPVTAKASLASIFEIHIGLVEEFVRSYSMMGNNEYLENFLSFLNRRSVPLIDGAIYFHSTRVLAREYFCHGLLPLNRNDFVSRIKKMLKKGTIAHRLYGNISDNQRWGLVKPVEDTGPCGTMIYDSKSEMDEDYHDAPEAIWDSMTSLPYTEKQLVMDAFRLKTVPKTVMFWSEKIVDVEKSLEGLIGYILLSECKIKASVLDFDQGYDRGKVRARDIVGLRVHPYYISNIEESCLDTASAEETPVSIFPFLKNH